ncbi:MAG: hypothetical protein CMJ80_00480 [Planctomycetaceae bacterium]|nr:hypothetical protein [Planctomycetaceae bacterium]
MAPRSEIEERARAQFLLGEFEAAKNTCNLIISRNRNKSYFAFYLLGRIAEKNEQYDRAVELLMKSIETYPRFVSAYLDLGNILLQGGLTQDAVYCFRKAVEIDPTRVASYENLTKAYQEIDFQQWESLTS